MADGLSSGNEGAPLLDPSIGHINASSSLTDYDGPVTRIDGYHPHSTGRAPRNSYLTTGFSIIATMAGVGVLGMPTAVATSGWVGIVLLLVTASIAMVTANLLGAVMTRMPQSTIRDYTSLAGAAFGPTGVVLTNMSQYITLSGVSVIFLLLSGIVLNDIFCAVPNRLFTLGVGVLVLLVIIIFPNAREVSWSSYVAVFTTLGATVIAVVLSLIFYLNPDTPCRSATPSPCSSCEHSFVTTFQGLGLGFSTFAFAFGGHSLLPNFFIEMKYPSHWWKATAVAYPTTAFLLYIPIAVAGYLAYGSAAAGPYLTVLDINSSFDPQRKIVADIAGGIIAVHVITALPIIVTPLCMKAQRIFVKEKADRLRRSPALVVTRVVIVSLLTLVAILLPYFLDVLSVVTAISVTADVFIFPALIFWKLRVNPAKNGMAYSVFVCIGLVCILIFGFVGSAASLYHAIPSLIHDVKKGGNPFSNIFTFGCPVPSGQSPAPGLTLNQTLTSNYTCTI